MAGRAHVAHAAMISLHAVCCGAPALAMVVAALSGVASAGYIFGSLTKIHAFLHHHEIWIVAVSATLVLTGGALEAWERRRGAQSFPWLFAFSVLCFAANLALVVAHRLLTASV